MADLTMCAGCSRHIRASEAQCPFCSSSRIPRRLLELSVAATATFTLAACYGAPPRAAHNEGHVDRFTFRVTAEPGGRARATANARAQGCDVNSGAMLKVQCSNVDLEMTEAQDGALDVSCAAASEAQCRALVDQLTAKPK